MPIEAVCAAITWVYLVEALKGSPRVSWLHYRSGGRLWIANVLGALVIAVVTARSTWLMVAWQLVLLQLVLYDVAIKRSKGGIR